MSLLACLAHRLGSFGADSLGFKDVPGELTSRALRLLSAGVRAGTSTRRDSFEPSFPAVRALGLGGD